MSQKRVSKYVIIPVISEYDEEGDPLSDQSYGQQGQQIILFKPFGLKLEELTVKINAELKAAPALPEEARR
jgi:hypothetical protein